MRGPALICALLTFALPGVVQSQSKSASQAQINGINEKFTAIGRPNSLTPSFDPIRGDLHFKFLTQEGNLGVGVVTPEGVMQLSIIVPGTSVRVLSSARIDLDANGREKQSQLATQGQLRGLSNSLNAAEARLDTLVVTMDAEGNVTYEFTTSGGEKVKIDIAP